MSINLDDLKEINDIDKVKTFIKTFILTNEQLYRLIFFNYKNPFDEITCSYPEDPYRIFKESLDTDDPHGVVLFSRKNNSIQNSETLNVLIDFETIQKGNYKEFSTNYIIIRVVAKGVSIQKLENDIDRSYAIFKLLDDELNQADVNGLGIVERKNISELPTNEENSGYMAMYKFSSFSYDYINNKNIQKRILGCDINE